MKAILKTYKRKGERKETARTAILQTCKIVERVFAHYNSIGLTAALEENAYAALQAYSGLYPEVIDYLRGADVTEDEIQKVRDLCQRARDELLLRASTSSLNLTHIMNNIIAQLKMAESLPASSAIVPLGILKFLACAGSIAVTVGTAVATVGACVGCVGNPNLPDCLGCAGGILATVGAAALTAAACAG